MPRKGPAPRRPLVSDPVYSSPLVTQLVNKVLKDGKRSLAERIVYARPRGHPRQDRHRPRRHAQARAGQREARAGGESRRVGGATYQVPVEVRAVRQTTLGLRWLVVLRPQRREKTMVERLMNELLDASNGLGASRQAARGHAQDGGVQQGLRPLPLVTRPTVGRQSSRES